MMKIKENIIEIFVTIGILVILLYSSTPNIYPDSQRYITGNLYDPPFYYTLIAIMQFIFGTLNSVVILQTLVIGFSIIYFSKILTIYFNLDVLTKSIIIFFLYIPILQFYNHLLTEPIGYGFSLLLVSFIIKLIYNFNIQNIIWITIFVIVLLLLRNQFLFLYPVIILLYLGIFILYQTKKNFFYLIISLFFIFTIHSALLSLNKYIGKNSSKNTNITIDTKGVFFFIYIDSIYISSEKDAESFKNKNIRKTVGIILKEMENKKASLKNYDSRGHFSLSLKEIRNYSDILLKDLALKENTTVNKLKKIISIKLITLNFNKYIKHTFKKFYDSTWLFAFVPFFMMIASFIGFNKYKSKYSLLILFLSIFSLANHSVVYLFGRVQPRYFIYTDFVLLIFIFITFVIFFKKRNNFNKF